MTTATAEPEAKNSDTLTSVFALTATAGLASLAFLGAADPMTIGLGAVAAVSGIGAAAQSLDPSVRLPIAVAAITSFVLALPMEFLTEHIVFPYAHESAPGEVTIGWANSVLVPFYDAVGEFFGLEPLGQAVEGVPQADF